jgi:NAD(P) transhydrogenase subunit alpha
VRLAVPRERAHGERRVALVPDAVGRLRAAGVEVSVEVDAGAQASADDDAYRAAGADIRADRAELLADAGVVLMVGRLEPAEVDDMRAGQVLIGMLAPLTHPELVDALAARGVTAISMDAIPRVTRAQAMDALSSQSTVAGYKAIVLAASLLPRFFPMLMTAAGTIAPARVFVLGAGVAGLQAIATARRLGAVVSAFDTRPVVREQVESLGATFVELDLAVDGAQDARGYATELSEEQQAAQRALVARHVAESDVVVTTALVPGRPAPLLIPADAVAGMRHGSVIVDLAAEAGGNCELTEPGETVVRESVYVVGLRNLPATVPFHASAMYARNVSALVAHIVRDGELVLDLEDEILADACITHEGRVVSRLLQPVAT